MSTNYYTVKKCNHCRHEERLHIGKSACGWCFALATHDDITSLDDWREQFEEPDVTIVDEYDRPVTPEEMFKIITERSGKGDWRGAPGHFQPGPNGLRRSLIDGEHCIGYGTGTWDIMRGEFS